MRAIGTWMIGAIILCRPKKSQWQRGYPPPRARQGMEEGAFEDEIRQWQSRDGVGRGR